MARGDLAPPSPCLRILYCMPDAVSLTPSLSAFACNHSQPAGVVGIPAWLRGGGGLACRQLPAAASAGPRVAFLSSTCFAHTAQAMQRCLKANVEGDCYGCIALGYTRIFYRSFL